MNSNSPEKIIRDLNGKTDAERAASKSFRRKLALGGLVLSTAVALSPQIEQVAHQGSKVMHFTTKHLGDALHNNNVQNDFNTFNLANPDELSKVLTHDGMTKKDVTIYTIHDSEFTNHDVAVDLHAKNAEKLAGMIEAQLSDPVTQVEGDIQGRVIVVPKDMLNK